MKNAVLCFIFLGFTSYLTAVEYQDYVNYKVIDKDQDFKVETVELRKWSESYARIWSYDQSMAKTAFPLGDFLLTKVDGDKNKEISKTELRNFQNLLKPIFERAYLVFIEKHDSNGNGRIESSERTSAHINYPKFIHFFNKNLQGILPNQEVAKLGPNLPHGEGNEPKAGRGESGRKFDDIYD